MYRPSGGSGEVDDWNQQVWVTESQSLVGPKKERNNSFTFLSNRDVAMSVQFFPMLLKKKKKVSSFYDCMI